MEMEVTGHEHVGTLSCWDCSWASCVSGFQHWNPCGLSSGCPVSICTAQIEIIMAANQFTLWFHLADCVRQCCVCAEAPASVHKQHTTNEVLFGGIRTLQPVLNLAKHERVKTTCGHHCCSGSNFLAHWHVHQALRSKVTLSRQRNTSLAVSSSVMPSFGLCTCGRCASEWDIKWTLICVCFDAVRIGLLTEVRERTHKHTCGNGCVNIGLDSTSKIYVL